MRFLDSDEEENKKNIHIFEEQYQILLNLIEIPDFGNVYEYWNIVRDDLSFISEIALRLLSMPCSEAAVERLFLHLKYLFGNRNSESSEDLINAELAIKMQQIYDKNICIMTKNSKDKSKNNYYIKVFKN